MSYIVSLQIDFTLESALPDAQIWTKDQIFMIQPAFRKHS